MALRMPDTGTAVIESCAEGVPPAVRRYSEDIARLIVKTRMAVPAAVTMTTAAPVAPTAAHHELDELFKVAGWKANTDVEVTATIKPRSSLLGDFPKFSQLVADDSAPLPGNLELLLLFMQQPLMFLLLICQRYSS